MCSRYYIVFRRFNLLTLIKYRAFDRELKKLVLVLKRGENINDDGIVRLVLIPRQ